MEMKFQSLVLLVLLCAVAQGKVFERCKWARFLKKHGMDNYQGISLADWVCLTQHESSYNTDAKNKNKNGSTDYGILQINSKWWCKDGGVNRANGCDIDCAELRDPIVSIKCAKIVVKDPNGIKAWRAWTCKCKGKNLKKYLKGCGL